MKKKWLSALTLSAALVASGCSGGEETGSGGNGNGEVVTAPTFPEGTTMDRIQDAGTMKVGVKFDQPGFGRKNLQGQVEGFDVEIAKRIAQGIFGGTVEQAAQKIEFVEAQSRVREVYLQNGTVDMVVATYTINNNRKNQIDFAGPYYVAGGDLLVKQDNTTIKSLADVAGKRVCTARGSTYPATLREKVPTAQVTELGGYSECVEGLRDGRYDAVATDNVILAAFVANNPGQYKLVLDKYTTEPYGIGVKKNDDAFRNFINDRLQTLYDNGGWKAAYDATFAAIGGPAPQPPAIDRYAGNGAPAVVATTVAPTTTAAGGTPTTAAAGGGSASGGATTTTAAVAGNATTTTAAR